MCPHPANCRKGGDAPEEKTEAPPKMVWQEGSSLMYISPRDIFRGSSTYAATETSDTPGGWDVEQHSQPGHFMGQSFQAHAHVQSCYCCTADCDDSSELC